MTLRRADGRPMFDEPVITLESIQRDPSAPSLAVYVAGIVLRREIDPVDALNALEVLVDAVGLHVDMLQELHALT